MKNLEEALEQIDLLTKERDNLKNIYEDSKVYIGQEKIDLLIEERDKLKIYVQSTIGIPTGLESSIPKVINISLIYLDCIM